MKIFNIRRTVLANLVAIFIVLNVPVYIMNFYITQHAEQNILKRSTDAIGSNARYFLDSFETEIQRIDRLKNEYLSNEEFLQLAIEGPYLDPYTKNSLILSVKDKLALLKTSSTFVKDVKVYFPNLQRGVFASSYENQIAKEDVRRMLGSYKDKSMLHTSRTGLALGGLYPVPLTDDNFIHSIEIELSEPSIKKMLANIGSTDNHQSGVAILYNPKGHWSVSNHAEWQESTRLSALTDAVKQGGEPKGDYVIADVERESYMIMHEKSDILGVELLVAVPEAEFTGMLSRYSYMLYSILVVSLLFVLLFAYWIYRLIHQPFQRLMAGLRRIEQGDFETVLSTRKGDEFSIVYRQFNSMASRLKTLIQEVYEHKIRLQLSELKQLQSQINPHFLYNSYYVIYRLAQRHDVEQVAEYTRYLGDYFKYITRNASEMVALADEMNHADAYIRIQMLRFSNRIKTDTEPLPEEIGKLQVPKLLIQPLIENAYTHGVESKLRDGYVRLSFTRTDQDLHIIIEDNGEGLSDGALGELRERLSLMNEDNTVDETTGMLNVHKRLQLKYGSPYGLSAERSGLGGLKIVMMIPLTIDNMHEARSERDV
ncbi:sensor histidine kinase [Paenibacillus mendelii]|uniref:Sensor histidine kinase n=1 Tax=Paenibacillus mendelii TaxID=206163 RepID=A0ABV6J361_9BACL|nr:histidine kinase [Paenibacillus mendelii]MCQ6559424.1 histidine kinase [Paenibacillus mendelii]